MVDIEELERLHASMPQLRAETWNHEDGDGHAAIIAVLGSEEYCEDEHPDAYEAAVTGVRLINALPGLIAELRALRAVATQGRIVALAEDVSWADLLRELGIFYAALAKVPK